MLFQPPCCSYVPLTSPLTRLPTFLLCQVILPVALGFAAGCMVWMVLAELLPDALERADARLVSCHVGRLVCCYEGEAWKVQHVLPCRLGTWGPP